MRKTKPQQSVKPKLRQWVCKPCWELKYCPTGHSSSSSRFTPRIKAYRLSPGFTAALARSWLPVGSDQTTRCLE